MTENAQREESDAPPTEDSTGVDVTAPRQETPPQAESGDSGEGEDGPELLDLDDRVLCIDGACIGVVGSDGLCKECGKPGDPAEIGRIARSPGVPAADGAEREPETESATSALTTPQPDEPPADEVVADSDDGPFDPSSRVLCPDGNCIGVIGPTGQCKECGKPTTWKPADDDQTNDEGHDDEGEGQDEDEGEDQDEGDEHEGEDPDEADRGGDRSQDTGS